MSAHSSASDDSKVEKPSFFKLFTEPLRAIGERKNAFFAIRKIKPVQKGDGHPILVIPGFLGTDHATYHLRKYLSKLGYRAFPWEQGINLGNVKKMNLIVEEIERLHDKYQTKVTLIGWSLGGVYARQIAKERPELIRQVIMLAAPFRGMTLPNHASWLFRLINDQRGEVAVEDQKWLGDIEDIPNPPPVPSLAIYSKEDGIVPWNVCLEVAPNDKHQNAEVKGSHQGMPSNTQAWEVIAAYLNRRVK